MIGAGERAELTEVDLSDVANTEFGADSEGEGDNWEMLRLGRALELTLPRPIRSRRRGPSSEESLELGSFDVRASVCRAVGGFEHGQKVLTKTRPPRYLTVVGVRRGGDGRPRLYFEEEEGEAGAFELADVARTAAELECLERDSF
jgi:hypothetical protein